MKKRDFRIDLLRAFACIVVLFCHSPQVFDGQSGAFLVAINNFYGMAWGPILFFAISGACLLETPREAIPFLKKRMSRILIPTIVWSVIYVFLQCFLWDTFPKEDFLNKLAMMLIEPQYGLLWFMYALISIYLVTPILSRWIDQCTPKEIRFYLVLWGIGLCLPYMDLFDINSNSVFASNGLLHYFSGYLWCGVAGFYCRKYVRLNVVSVRGKIISLIILLSPLYVFLIKHLTGKVVDGSSTLLSMLVTLYAIVFIYSIDVFWLESKKKFALIVNNLSKYSFGIYLCHMVLLHPFRHWIASFGINYAIQIPLTAIFIGVVSYSFVWLISKISISKYVIG